LAFNVNVAAACRAIRAVRAGRVVMAVASAALLATCAAAQTSPALEAAPVSDSIMPAAPSEAEDTQQWLATRFWSAVEQRQRQCAGRLYLVPGVSLERPTRAFLQCHADAAANPALSLRAEWLPALHILAGHYVREPADLTLLDVLRRRHPVTYAAVVSACASGESAIALMFLSDDLGRNHGTPRLDPAIFTPECRDRVRAFDGVTIRTCPELGFLCRRTGFNFITAVARFHRDQAYWSPTGD
jgi:hypothetical protein